MSVIDLNFSNGNLWFFDLDIDAGFFNVCHCPVNIKVVQMV